MNDKTTYYGEKMVEMRMYSGTGRLQYRFKAPNGNDDSHCWPPRDWRWSQWFDVEVVSDYPDSDARQFIPINQYAMIKAINYLGMITWLLKQETRQRLIKA